MMVGWRGVCVFHQDGNEEGGEPQKGGDQLNACGACLLILSLSKHLGGKGGGCPNSEKIQVEDEY